MTYEFDELPLIVTNGIDACLVNGQAEIEYHRSGAWQILSISIEGYRHLTFKERDEGIKPWVFVTAPPVLETMIRDRLEGTWCDKVTDAVQDRLASDREDAADQRADMRRDFLMGL